MDWTVVHDDERYLVRDALAGRMVISETRLYPGQSTRGHSHPHPETLFVTEGSGTLILDGARRIDLGVGGFHLLPGGSHHRVETAGGITFVCVFTGARAASTYGPSEPPAST